MPPKAAKLVEGIVLVVDVGEAVRAGTDVTFFQQSKTCLSNILQRKIFADKCTDHVGIVLFGTDETKNNLADGDQYQHISELQEPQFVDWDIIEKVNNLPRGFSKADWVDALVVGIDMLHRPGFNFDKKKIVLMTDFSNEFSASGSEEIMQGLKNSGIDLSVIGPNLGNDDDDDSADGPGPSNGTTYHSPLNWNGKPKSKIQIAGEALAAQIVSEVNGLILSFDEAIPQLIFYQKKSSGAANWNSTLDLGPDLQIPIIGRIKIKPSVANSWKTRYLKDKEAAFDKEVSYHKQDDNQTEIPEEEIIHGYNYGTTLVPFSEEDEQLKYTSGAERSALSVIKFTKAQYIPLGYRAGEQVVMITARPGDENATRAVSALIHALSELNMVGVTRRIYRKNSNPVVGALFPEINDDFECLVWVPLPFQEDVRSFRFPSLKKLTEKITSTEREAMDSLIDAMDLTAQDDDDEELDPTTVLNPSHQHLFNSLTHRALNPNGRLPAPEPHVMQILATPQHLLENQEKVCKKLSATFPTKLVIKRTKRERDNLFADDGEASDAKKPRSEEDGEGDLSLNDLVSSAATTTITTASPVNDFYFLLKNGTEYSSVCKQMGDVILKLLDGLDSSNNAIFNKVIDCIKAYRLESASIDPSHYNEFIISLKQVVLGKQFTALWTVVKQDKLGIITKDETLKSSKTLEEAETFLQETPTTAGPSAAAAPQVEEDDDDMLDCM